MSQLPLQLRKDVRDIFDKPDGPVQTAFKKLSTVIGWPVTCDVEWQMLWTELSSSYPDKSTFVPSVGGVVEAWVDTLARRMDDDKYEDWNTEFLERLEPVSKVKILIEASHDSRPRTTWLDSKLAFIVTLPKKTVSRGSTAISGFQTDFESLFEEQRPSAQVDQSQSFSKEDSDWANVDSFADTRSMSIRAREANHDESPVEVLPSVQTLPRPEVLFQSLTPYLMHVSSSGSARVVVNGTHEPSLRLLAEYLQRWTKTDPQDIRKLPYFRIKLTESNFGMGLFHDTIWIEPHDHMQRQTVINTTLILAFIQGVLGYTMVSETSGGSTWEFRRFTPFRA